MQRIIEMPPEVVIGRTLDDPEATARSDADTLPDIERGLHDREAAIDPGAVRRSRMADLRENLRMVDDALAPLLGPLPDMRVAGSEVETERLALTVTLEAPELTSGARYGRLARRAERKVVDALVERGVSRAKAEWTYRAADKRYGDEIRSLTVWVDAPVRGPAASPAEQPSP